MANPWDDLPDAPAKKNPWDALPDAPESQGKGVIVDKAGVRHFPMLKGKNATPDPDIVQEPEKGLDVADSLMPLGELGKDAWKNAKGVKNGEAGSWSKLADDVVAGPDIAKASMNAATRGARAGAAQVMSGSFSDEMEGALNAALAGGGLKINDNNDLSKGLSTREPAVNWDQLKKAYYEATNARRGDIQQAHKDQPGGYVAGELAGGMLIPVPGLEKIKAAKTIGEAAKYGLAYGAPTAAALGEVNYLGSTDDEHPATLGGAIKAPVVAGVTGGLLGMGSAAGGKLLSNLAEKSAVRAVAPQAGISNRLRNEGLGRPEQIQEFGRNLLDEKIVPWSGSKEEALNRAEGLMENKAGPEVSSYLKKLDKAQTAGGQQFDYAQFGAEADHGLPHANAVSQLAQDKGVKLAEALENQGKLTPGSFNGAWEAKRAAQRALNFSDEAPEAQQIARNVEQHARSNIHWQAFQAALRNRRNELLAQGVAPGKALQMAQDEATQQAHTFSEALNRYRTGAQAAELAKEATGRNALKASIGLPEVMSFLMGMAPGAATHGPGGGVLSGLTTAALTHAIRSPRLPGFLARSEDAASKASQLLTPSKTPWAEFVGADKDDEEQK